MKTLRNLVVLGFFLIFVSNVEAQWATNGSHIYNTNSGYVGVGISNPTSLLHAAKNMTGAQMIIENLGGDGGAGFTMIDGASTANWKFKATQYGGFKIRDNTMGLDVITIEQNSAPNRIYIGSNQLVGINTIPVPHPFGGGLEVEGDLWVHDDNAFVIVDNTLTGSNSGLCIATNGSYKGWLWYSDNDEVVRLNCDYSGFANHIVIHPSGEVGIGTATTKSGYKLSVDGKVACEEVLVENSTNWPDYVFEEDYDLMSLEELEESIKQNNQLPGMPSASEVEKNGLSLGEMQRIFLEKLEELTLYTIEQGKQIKAQQKKIEALEKENKRLRK